MKIRLVASDMDGTLLDPLSHISEENANAIRELQQSGAEFVICSGRAYSGAHPIVSGAGIRCSYICLSGAMICTEDGKARTSIPLTPGNLADIDRILTDAGIFMDIMTSNGVYCTFPREERLQRIYRFFDDGSLAAGQPSAALEQAVSRFASAFTFVGSLADVPSGTVIYKIGSTEIPAETVVRLKERFSACPDIATASTFPTDIELTNVRAQKGLALKAYARERGILPEEIMVLGDSDNDLSMFAPEFGWTVAMGNAQDCLKAVAKYETKSNREDGVAFAIRKYAL